MVFQPDSAIDKTIKVMTTTQVNRVFVTDFHFMNPAPFPPPPATVFGNGYPAAGTAPEPTLVVRVSFGNEDEDGYYMQTHQETFSFTGPTLTTVLNALVTNGKTRYNEVKDALYALLQSEGHLPSGTIT